MNINTRDLGFVNFNGQEMNFIKFNNTLVYENWKAYIISDVPPITLLNCKQAPLKNYEVYGNSIQGMESILPSEYQQLEYIKSTGTQYIDSGVPLVQGLKTVVDMIFTETSSGNTYTGGHIGNNPRS